jgi:hypothetical protein
MRSRPIAVAAFTRGWSTSVRALALPAANLGVFGALLVVHFVLLDRLLFSIPQPTKEAVQ